MSAGRPEGQTVHPRVESRTGLVYFQSASLAKVSKSVEVSNRRKKRLEYPGVTGRADACVCKSHTYVCACEKVVTIDNQVQNTTKTVKTEKNVRAVGCSVSSWLWLHVPSLLSV